MQIEKGSGIRLGIQLCRWRAVSSTCPFNWRTNCVCRNRVLTVTKHRADTVLWQLGAQMHAGVFGLRADVVLLLGEFVVEGDAAGCFCRALVGLVWLVNEAVYLAG